ncbi:MAG: amidohydrolase family protein [Pseudomonadota bacterium]
MMYNCHIHLFTTKHVPNRFAGIPFLTVSIARFVVTRLYPVAWLITGLIKAWYRLKGKPDGASRLLRFLAIGLEETQAEVFERIRYNYPRNTRFVVLPMDMDAMGRGALAVTVEAQHQELFDLAKTLRDANQDKPADQQDAEIIPFAHVDPRREDAIDRFRALHEAGAQGLKIYPNLGYLPTHPRLMGPVGNPKSGLFGYCQTHNLPVMTHCSGGGVHGAVTGNVLAPDGSTRHQGRLLQREEARTLGDPEHFRDVLTTFPDLRVCLAHFGGLDAWREYFANPISRRPPNDEIPMNWLSKLSGMLRETDGMDASGAPRARFPNLYTDISYTIFFFSDFHRALKIFLQNDLVRARTLFGSDFYMTEIEKFPESQLSIGLRAELGEATFAQISQQNPQLYLYGSQLHAVDTMT